MLVVAPRNCACFRYRTASLWQARSPHENTCPARCLFFFLTREHEAHDAAGMADNEANWRGERNMPAPGTASTGVGYADSPRPRGRGPCLELRWNGAEESIPFCHRQSLSLTTPGSTGVTVVTPPPVHIAPDIITFIKPQPSHFVYNKKKDGTESHFLLPRRRDHTCDPDCNPPLE